MTTSPASVSKLTALEAATSLSSNIRDKTVLITGTSPNSLGARTALAIASASPKLLILATRDSTKNEQTASEIRQSFPETNLKLVTLDLASLSSVREVATQLVADQAVPKLDVLINNAGVMGTAYSLTIDGIESQFAINFIGHFLLTNLLLKQNKLSSSAIVVNVSSDAYTMSDARLVFEDYNWERSEYNKWAAYAASKSANVLFSRALNRKFGSGGHRDTRQSIRSRAVHPGVIFTNLGRHLTAEDISLLEGYKLEVVSLDIGAGEIVNAAFQEKTGDEEGVYWKDGHPGETLELAKEWMTGVENEERLWMLGEKLVEEDC
jgi:NAD(P)-dependent dehydrogenase (short-subunit alcohol dehydrogenase family)